MRISNNEISTDNDVHTKSNNLIYTGISSTFNSFNDAWVPILTKKTTMKTLISTHPQPNIKSSATSKAKQKNRSQAEATCKKFLGPYSSIFYNSLGQIRHKNCTIENKIYCQHKPSKEGLQHSTNMNIGHEYLNKVKILKYMHLAVRSAQNLFNLTIPNTIRLEASKYLPDPKSRLMTFISTKCKSRREALIGLKTIGVIYSLRHLT